jgi:hypothetical protein
MVAQCRHPIEATGWFSEPPTWFKAANAKVSPVRHHGNQRPIDERFPKQGRAHQAGDHGRGLIRINCNHGVAGYEKSRIYTADSVLAVRIEQLALNAPNTKVTS